MRLLVIEDDVSIQQFVKRALIEAGYQVDTASSAKMLNHVLHHTYTGYAQQPHFNSSFEAAQALEALGVQPGDPGRLHHSGGL
jgi:hypothetical protein